jgi:hypothetical protein
MLDTIDNWRDKSQDSWGWSGIEGSQSNHNAWIKGIEDKEARYALAIEWPVFRGTLIYYYSEH